MATSAPANSAHFLELVRKSGLVSPDAVRAVFEEIDEPADAYGCATALIRANVLTPFQAQNLLAGRYRGMVLGPYRLLRLLGKGGMGAVYLAEQSTLNRRVAVKVLNKDQAQDALGLERFFREARSAAALEHKNIVRLYDVCHIDGVHFLVMEYADGTDLDSLLEQTGRMHSGQAADYIAQAAMGLQHAHAKGFVHRDIKPANLILCKDGTVKILDMGLARCVVNPNDELTGKLGEEVITGTVDYISPEQAMNVLLDSRSDLYSLGATFVTLLTGQPPYSGSTAQKLTQHQMSPPPDLAKVRADLPPELIAIVARMMAKVPRDRFQSAAEVVAALTPWAASGGPASSQNTVNLASSVTRVDMGSAKPGEKRRARLSWIAAVAVVAVIAAGVGLWAALGRDKPREQAQSDTPTEPRPAPGQPDQKSVPPVAVDAGKPTPRPAPAPAVVPLLALDFAQADPASFETTVGVKGKQNLTGSGAPPAGWVFSHTGGSEGDARYECRVEGGRKLIGLRKLTGRGGVQLQSVLGPPMLAGRSYTLAIEYRASANFRGQVQVRRKWQEWNNVPQLTLESTDGKWVSNSLPIAPTEDWPTILVVQNMSKELTANEFEFRRLEIVPVNPLSAWTEGKLVYALDVAKVPVFRVQKEGSRRTGGDEEQLPAGVVCKCWKTEAVGEFRRAEIGGFSALGVTNLNEQLSGQFTFEIEQGLQLTLEPGRAYRAKISYRTDNEGIGEVNVQAVPGFKALRTEGLPATRGEWKTVTVSFVRPSESTALLTINNMAVGEGNTLWIRSVELVELTPSN